MPTFDDNVSPTFSHSSGLYPIGLENSCSNSTTQLNFIVPNNEELLTRGASLQSKPQTELHAYPRRRNH